MIHVIATVEVAEGKRDAMLKEFRQVAPRVRAEAGCIEYGAAVDLKTDISVQAPVREKTVVIVEKWESLEALKAHLTAPHMTEYRQKIRELVKGVHLQVLQPA